MKSIYYIIFSRSKLINKNLRILFIDKTVKTKYSSLISATFYSLDLVRKPSLYRLEYR